MSTTVKTQDIDPIYTKGNWFWKDDERFLIKGISYLPRTEGGHPYGAESKIDPLEDARLEELKRDIEIFQELGLNTIQISALKPDKSHAKAMELLADAGMYVLVTVLDDFRTSGDEQINIAKSYHAGLLKPVLKVVNEMAQYPNLLGFVVAAEAINTNQSSKLAELYGASIRDIKSFLRQRGERCPPVGVSVNDIMMLKRLMLKYFTAGSQQDRADFFGMDCWSWAAKSDFQISGWKNMVQNFSRYPVPMYLSAFGARVGKPRLWEEIKCLYSGDMTGVFSGGCLYTYLESGNGYGIVIAKGDGVERKEKEFKRLKDQFHKVNIKDEDEFDVEECKDYESWRGEFPETGERWLPTSALPGLDGGIESLIQSINDEKVDKATTLGVSPSRSENHEESGFVARLTERVDRLDITRDV